MDTSVRPINEEAPEERPISYPRTIVGLFMFLQTRFHWPAEVMSAVQPAFEHVEGYYNAALRTLEQQVDTLTERAATNHPSWDPRTKLPGEPAFIEAMKYQIMTEKRKPTVGWFFIDLDRFKVFNDLDDTWGLGNLALTETANILRTAIREDDQLFRYGGDEFALIISGPEKIDDLLSLASHLDQRVLAHPWDALDRRFEQHLPRLNISCIFTELPSDEDRQIILSDPTTAPRLVDDTINSLKRLNNGAKADRLLRGVVTAHSRAGKYFNSQLLDATDAQHRRRLVETLPEHVDLPR